MGNTKEDIKRKLADAEKEWEKILLNIWEEMKKKHEENKTIATFKKIIHDELVNFANDISKTFDEKINTLEKEIENLKGEK